MRTFGEAADKHGLPVSQYAFDGVYLNLTIYRHVQAAVGALKADVLKALNADGKRSWEFLATKTSVTESIVEDAALTWLGELGYVVVRWTVQYGRDGQNGRGRGRMISWNPNHSSQNTAAIES